MNLRTNRPMSGLRAISAIAVVSVLAACLPSATPEPTTTPSATATTAPSTAPSAAATARPTATPEPSVEPTPEAAAFSAAYRIPFTVSCGAPMAGYDVGAPVCDTDTDLPSVAMLYADADGAELTAVRFGLILVAEDADSGREAGTRLALAMTEAAGEISSFGYDAPGQLTPGLLTGDYEVDVSLETTVAGELRGDVVLLTVVETPWIGPDTDCRIPGPYSSAFVMPDVSLGEHTGIEATDGTDAVVIEPFDPADIEGDCTPPPGLAPGEDGMPPGGGPGS